VYPDADEDESDATRDAAYAAKQRRLTDAWQTPVQSSTEARLVEPTRRIPACVPQRDGTSLRDRESAYDAKVERMEGAWKVAT
jgi:hypothetical protein